MKLRRKLEKWQSYSATDGNLVLLPPFMLDILRSDELKPDPRTRFNSLLNVRAGNQITSMKLGENPKFFAQGYQGHEFIVTEQMMTLWEELENDSEWSIKKCLSGPMDVGKSYISWFLAAKAYAHGWLVLYIADAKVLNDSNSEEDVSTVICERFLALIKDILTSRELREMVNFQDKTKPLVVSTSGHILRKLLQQQDRKTLFIIDEHGALFPDNNVPATIRLNILKPMDSFNSWSPSSWSPCCVYRTAKFERTILRDSSAYLVFVGPLSLEISNSLLDAVSTKFHSTVKQHVNSLRDEIHRVTGCMPRELINLAISIGTDSLTIQEVIKKLQDYEKLRQEEIYDILQNYYLALDEWGRSGIRKALTDVFLPGNKRPSMSFDWRFMDFGVIYQYWNKRGTLTLNHPITPAAEMALLDLYKTCPLPNDYIYDIRQGTLKSADFEDAIFQLLIKSTNMSLKTTNLVGRDEQTLELTVNGFEYLQTPPRYIGERAREILIHGSELPRFDFLLGYIFIQVSLSSFQVHNNDVTANFDLAFTDRTYPGGRNQVEYFLDCTYGGVHKAVMDTTDLPLKKSKARNSDTNDGVQGEAKVRFRRNFIVKKDGVLCPDFMIVYIHGRNDLDAEGKKIHGPPHHTDKVQEYPQIRHICWDEIKKSLLEVDLLKNT